MLSREDASIATLQATQEAGLIPSARHRDSMKLLEGTSCYTPLVNGEAGKASRLNSAGSRPRSPAVTDQRMGACSAATCRAADSCCDHGCGPPPPQPGNRGSLSSLTDMTRVLVLVRSEKRLRDSMTSSDSVSAAITINSPVASAVGPADVARPASSAGSAHVVRFADTTTEMRATTPMPITRPASAIPPSLTPAVAPQRSREPPSLFPNIARPNTATSVGSGLRWGVKTRRSIKNERNSDLASTAAVAQAIRCRSAARESWKANSQATAVSILAAGNAQDKLVKSAHNVSYPTLPCRAQSTRFGGTACVDPIERRSAHDYLCSIASDLDAFESCPSRKVNRSSGSQAHISQPMRSDAISRVSSAATLRVAYTGPPNSTAGHSLNAKQSLRSLHQLDCVTMGVACSNVKTKRVLPVDAKLQSAAFAPKDKTVAGDFFRQFYEKRHAL